MNTEDFCFGYTHGVRSSCCLFGFVGILAVIGAALSYMEGGLTETVYQYIAGGAAEAVLLMVIIRMSDEPYKIKSD